MRNYPIIVACLGMSSCTAVDHLERMVDSTPAVGVYPGPRTLEANHVQHTDAPTIPVRARAFNADRRAPGVEPCPPKEWGQYLQRTGKQKWVKKGGKHD